MWAAARTRSRSRHAFEILLSDTNVKAIFINIFGGILRVDVLATAVVARGEEDRMCRCRSCFGLKVRTWKKDARFLKDSGLNFQVGDTMKEAAELVVAAAKA